MKLQEITEPIFLYLCKINRIANGGGEMSQADARRDLNFLIEQAQSRASTSAEMKESFALIRTSLLIFIDFMIVDSGINFALDWNKSPLYNSETSGEEVFCEGLKSALADDSKSNEETLMFYFKCIGLGFGVNAELSDMLLQKLEGRLKSNPSERITRSAYDNVNVANFIRPVGGKLTLIFVIFVVFMISVAASVAFMYKESSSGIVRALKTINSHVETNLK